MQKLKLLPEIISKFNDINDFSKKILFYGLVLFILLLLFGFYTLTYCHWNNNYYYWNLFGKDLIKNSFVILAEFFFGGLIIDYIYKKK